MARILLLFATTEGHTARIAEHVGRVLREAGHRVDARRVQTATEELQVAAYDAVIVGASIHYGHHPGYLRALLRSRRADLAARPSAFFSVSLSAGGPGAKPAAAQRYLQAFLRQVGWQPRLSATFAGALQYSKYGAFKRGLMILFVGLAGGDTDTSRDYEYTDWDAVRRFAADFAQALGR